MTKNSLRDLDSHFAFGENWCAFAELVTEERITDAVFSLERLLSRSQLEGCRMLDIGCGAGLSMLAALRLGVTHIEGVDIDPSSVKAAKAVLGRFYADGPWEVDERSVFDLPRKVTHGFDIVHSWGVLHHTGAMWQAIDTACSLVSPKGLLCIALYRKTPFCRLWRAEKWIYTNTPRWLQALIRSLFKGAFVLGLLVTGQSPSKYFSEYKTARGMDWHHDVHDWLGGYPYESVTPEELSNFLDERGFAIERCFAKRAVAFGLFGSHCDEFVARKVK
jgi:2-polyprenyl-3-methyl-5-hydroxy-6-metoxy-1,4-benzoquinol methylase